MRAFTLALVVFAAVTTTASAEEEAQNEMSSLLGKRAAMKSRDNTEELMSRAILGKNFITNAVDDVKDWGEEAVSDAGDWTEGAINDVGDFTNAVAGGIEDLGSATLNTLEKAKDATISEFNNGVNALEQHVKSAGTWTENAAQDVGQWSDEAAGDIAEWAEDAAEDAKDAIEEAAEAIKDVALDVYNFIKSVFDMLGCAPSQEMLFDMVKQIAFPPSSSASIADVVALFTGGAGPLGSEDGTVASKACQTVWGALERTFPMMNTMSVLVAGLKDMCSIDDLNPALTFGFTVGANVVADVRAAMGGLEVGVGIDAKGNQMCYVGACVSAGIGLPPGPSAGLDAGGVVTFWPLGSKNIAGKSEIAHIGFGLSVLAEANATTSRRKASSDARSGLKVRATHLEERATEATATHTGGRRLADLIKAEKEQRDFQSGIDIGASFTAVFPSGKLMETAPVGYALGFNMGLGVSAGPEQTVPVSPTMEAGFGTCVTACVATRKVSSNSFDCGDIDNGDDNYPSASTSTDWSAPSDWMEEVNPHSHTPHDHTVCWGGCGRRRRRRRRSGL